MSDTSSEYRLLFFWRHWDFLPCGLREADGEHGLPELASGSDLAKVVNAVAQGGVAGVLQHQLTKSVQIPAAKLAYHLTTLEVQHVMRRDPVYLPSETTTDVLRTNVLTLPALRHSAMQTTAAPLSQYAQDDDDHTSLLGQMTAVLSRAPHQLLPTYKLRSELRLSGKGRPLQ